nr:hypothetical protein [Kiritimatiellia bacterium]
PWGMGFREAEPAPGWVAGPEADSLARSAQEAIDTKIEELSVKGSAARDWIRHHHSTEGMLTEIEAMYLKAAGQS